MKLPTWLRRSKPPVDSTLKFNQYLSLLESGRIDGTTTAALVQRGDSIDDYFSFGGVGYRGTPSAQSIADNREMGGADFESYVQKCFMSNSVVWACEQRRLNVFSEARPIFRKIVNGRPGDLHAGPSTYLEGLAEPWTNATFSDLLTRALLHADFGGNAYIVKTNGQYRLLRPDWVYIIMGSNGNPAASADEIDAEVVAYAYFPGGLSKFGESKPPVLLMPDEVAHFAPMPDPIAHYKGMSWLTPLFYELAGDQAANAHKLQFFKNGATLQYVVSLDKDVKPESFNRFIAMAKTQTQGLANAYKTLYMGGGANVKPIGVDLKQLDFKVVQGAGETRIAAAAGVPPIIAGLSEGLSAGTYNNYGQAKRSFVDGTIRPLWRNFFGSMQTIITTPVGSEFWYDDRDIAYLREDEKDRLTVLQMEASTIAALIAAGFEPDPVVDSVSARDVAILRGHHTGLFSVQLQPPILPGQAASANEGGTMPTQGASPGAGTPKTSSPGGAAGMAASKVSLPKPAGASTPKVAIPKPKAGA